MGRAAERALALLKPGKSLRFVTLPAGDDPDTLIASSGAGAFEALLETAKPLDLVIWEMECAGHRLDTPERLAGLESRLEARAFAIADQKVQYQYLSAFRQRLRELRREQGASQWSKNRKGFGSRGDYRGGTYRGDRQRYGRSYNTAGGPQNTAGGPQNLAGGPATPPETLKRRREQAVLATVLSHWALLDEFAETIGMVTFSDPVLDKLRQETLLLYARSPDLDSEAVARHLMETGCAQGLQAVLSSEVFVSARSARPESDENVARTGLLELIHGLRLEEAQKRYAEQPTDENWAWLQECQLTNIQRQRESL